MMSTIRYLLPSRPPPRGLVIDSPVLQVVVRTTPEDDNITIAVTVAGVARYLNRRAPYASSLPAVQDTAPVHLQHEPSQDAAQAFLTQAPVCPIRPKSEPLEKPLHRINMNAAKPGQCAARPRPRLHNAANLVNANVRSRVRSCRHAAVLTDARARKDCPV